MSLDFAAQSFLAAEAVLPPSEEIYAGHSVAVLQMLIDNDFNYDRSSPDKIKILVYSVRDLYEHDIYNLLVKAANRKRTKILDAMMKKFVPEYERLMTYLKLAVRKGDIELVKYLLEKADIHAERDIFAQLAAANGQLEVFRYLHEKGANIHVSEEQPLRTAVEMRRMNIVRYLLELPPGERANVHARDEGAIGNAALQGNLDIFRYLHEKGANIHVDEEHPLRVATEMGNMNIVRYLLELPPGERANVHAQNDYALRSAATLGRLDIVRYLHEKGANIHALDDTALRNAKRNGHDDVVRYLLENGANDTEDTSEDERWWREHRHDGFESSW